MSVFYIRDENGKFAAVPMLKGEDGKSAYEIALDKGFEGSEEDWIESLRGSDYILTEADKQDIAQMACENIEETDPTVPAWAKESNKPTYTANEVGAIAKSDVANDFEFDEEGTLINGDKIASIECLDKNYGRIVDIFGAELENKADKSYVDDLFNSIVNGNEVAY